jgi:hypothetical protein
VRVDDKRCRAILIQPGTIGQVDDIEDTLQAFRRVLGGHVEHIGAADRRISFWVNENGKLENMPVNRLPPPYGGCSVRRWQARYAQRPGHHHGRADQARRQHTRAEVDG